MMKAFLIIGIVAACIIICLHTNATSASTSKEHYDKQMIGYDMALSLDAHAQGLKTMCEQNGLKYIDNNGSPYCVIDNPARCKARNDELRSLPDTSEDSGWIAYWLPYADAPGGGVCVEIPNLVSQFCDAANADGPDGAVPPFVQYTNGAVYCNITGGYCNPINYDGGDVASISEDALVNLPTCRIFSNACVGQSYRDSSTNANGEIMGDCYRTIGQQIGEGALGTAAWYGKLKESGEKMVKDCSEDWASQACWEGIAKHTGSGMIISFGNLSVDTLKVYGPKVASDLSRDITSAVMMPTPRNVNQLYQTLITSSLGGQTQKFLGNMVDGMLGSISGANKLPNGFATFMLTNMGNMGTAVLLQLFDMSQAGYEKFKNWWDDGGREKVQQAFCKLPGIPCPSPPPSRNVVPSSNWQFMDSPVPANAPGTYRNFFVLANATENRCAVITNGPKDAFGRTRFVTYADDSICGEQSSLFTLGSDRKLRNVQTNECIAVDAANNVYPSPSSDACPTFKVLDRGNGTVKLATDAYLSYCLKAKGSSSASTAVDNKLEMGDCDDSNGGKWKFIYQSEPSNDPATSAKIKSLVQTRKMQAMECRDPTYLLNNSAYCRSLGVEACDVTSYRENNVTECIASGYAKELCGPNTTHTAECVQSGNIKSLCADATYLKNNVQSCKDAGYSFEPCTFTNYLFQNPQECRLRGVEACSYSEYRNMWDTGSTCSALGYGGTGGWNPSLPIW